MIEAHLSPAIEAPKGAEQFFYPLVSAQMEIEPDASKWLASGPAGDPYVEERALRHVQECFEAALVELESIDVWEVEYDASGRLPGLDVPVVAYIDIIGEHKKKGPVIWDWKTGGTKPDNFQLETYAALLMTEGSKTYDGFPFKGRYVMISPSYESSTRHVDLSSVSPTEVGAKYQEAYEAMTKKIYKTNHGFGCRFCFHQDNCRVNAGPLSARANYYDRSHEDGFEF